MPDRFLNKVNFTDTCWLWKGNMTDKGYGNYLISYDPATKRCQRMLVHRFSWTHFNREIPKGMLICHKCDVRNCVNPDHLFLGTHKDNAIDRNSKGRHFIIIGEANGRSKLTQEKADQIRKLHLPNGMCGKHSPHSTSSISKKFNVSYSTIYRVVKNEAWVASTLEEIN